MVTRACNIYGIGDYNRQRLIPGIVYAHLKNLEFVIRNGGKDFREYVHVEDVVDAYLKLLDYTEKNNSIGAFNISSEDGYTTIDLFNLIQKEIGSSIKHKIISEPTLEIVMQLMDSSLLKQETGWSPKNHMKNNIGEITRWYLNNI